jgi:hypothetical protein
MANTLDFLFEGQVPQSVTSYGQTVEGVPKWMSDYTQGLIARANAAAAEPYIPYGGPRIAGFSPEQEAAFGMVEENVGAYQPFLEAGAAGYGGGLSTAANIARSADPYLQQATGSFTDPGVAGQYMDPYIQNVLARQAEESGRQLTERFIPELQGAFTGAGQFGSRGGYGSMQDIGTRGVREIAEGLQGQQLAALSGAYGEAGRRYEAERGRYGQLATTRGALEEATAARMFEGAQGLGQMGEFAQQAGLTDAAAMEAIGRQTQGMDQASMDLAYQDFLEQRDLPMQRTAFMSDVIRGLPSPGGYTQTTQTGPANVYGPSLASQLIGGYGVYRGLNPPPAGTARGGYIEGEYEDVTGYADGGYVDADGYQFGGLAQAAQRAGAGIMEGGRRAIDWARSLYPDPGRGIGVAGGHDLTLEHKQD